MELEEAYERQRRDNAKLAGKCERLAALLADATAKVAALRWGPAPAGSPRTQDAARIKELKALCSKQGQLGISLQTQLHAAKDRIRTLERDLCRYRSRCAQSGTDPGVGGRSYVLNSPQRPVAILHSPG